ncbi:WD repeat-containing protein 75 [Bienertia sinuspersici]
MLKKGISKSKLLLDLNMVFKRGNELAGKAISGIAFHHNSFICKPNNPNNLFISPKKEYEFSCSNSPELGPFQLMMAQQKKARTKHSLRRHKYQLEDPTTVAAVQRVLEMLNANEGPTASPLVVNGQGHYCSSLPGFGYGKSPLSRQLRVTDSPFPLKDGKRNKEEEEEDGKVNKAADEFIKKFYKNLMNQKSLESPYHMSAR